MLYIDEDEDDEYQEEPDKDDGDIFYLAFSSSLEKEFDEETLYIVDITQIFKIPIQYFTKFIAY